MDDSFSTACLPRLHKVNVISQHRGAEAPADNAEAAEASKAPKAAAKSAKAAAMAPKESPRRASTRGRK